MTAKMYTLLTGATGLLGRYLMRDLLLRGGNVAVLVRPSRRASAVERVDAVLSYWETAWKRTLPRPVVLTGDIVQEGLGLSSSDRRWLAANCQAMIHSAASLTFYEDDGEPWRSNVQGVQHVLDVCEDLSIRRLYYVSTAYTCGLRNGTVYEDELDVGQEYGNDYERSKVQAEESIRRATCLDVAAIFRPSIIVGDSLIGFSSTFHGFYTPLRLVCALLTQVSHEQVFETDYMALMGLSGDEGKNLVPVDWVSRAIVSIIERYPARSQTYALASTSPVASARMMDVIRAVTTECRAAQSSPNTPAPSSLDLSASDPIMGAYLEQLHTYRSYWRNDPVFDCSNTIAALPDLPCPTLCDEILSRLAEWAVKCKFADPTEMGSQRSNRGWIRVDCNGQTTIMQDGPETECVLTITGPGGGSWTFDGRDSGRVRVWEGRFDGAPEMCVSNETLECIVARKTTIEAAAQAGDLVTVGRVGDLVTVGRVGDLTSWERILAAVRAQRPSA